MPFHLQPFDSPLERIAMVAIEIGLGEGLRGERGPIGAIDHW
jgi:hypothetical protein